MQLRWYQDEAIASIFNYYQQGNIGNPLVVLPTGSGKTPVIAFFLFKVLTQWPSQRILILTHTREIVKQNEAKLKGIWSNAPCGVYSAGLKRKELDRNIVFAGIQSLASIKGQLPWFDMVIIDEAHMINPKESTQYGKTLAKLKEINPSLAVWGLTATPYRSDGPIIGAGLFTDITIDLATGENYVRLVDEGYLTNLVAKSTEFKLDVSEVGKRGGEFIETELQAAVDNYEITLAAIKEAIIRGVGRKKWLVFCSGVEHAKHTAEILNTLGIPTAAIYSGMGDLERDQVLLDYHNGKYQALTNNNVLTVGYDEPSIDLLVILRPTASTNLWVQILGRGGRIFPGKIDCLVLDFAGNTKRCGKINDPIIPKRKGEGGGGDAPIKDCPQCYDFVPASTRICPGCGYEFPIKTELKSYASEEELIKRNEAPKTEIYKVDHMTLAIHNKKGKPPAVKVSYFSDLQQFSEYICVEHGGFATKKAKDWCKARGLEMPNTSVELIAMLQLQAAPTHIRVWTNAIPLPQILSCDYSGTAFNTKELTFTFDKVPVVEEIPEAFKNFEEDFTFLN